MGRPRPEAQARAVNPWLLAICAAGAGVVAWGLGFARRFWRYSLGPRYAGDKALRLHSRPVDFHSAWLGPYYADLRQCLRGASLDDLGVISYVIPGDRMYNPCAVAEYALVSHEDLLWATDQERERHLVAFRLHLDWLTSHAKIQGDGACFHYTYDTPDERAPWSSGITQGVAISALLRGFQLLGNRLYRDLALRAFHTLDSPVNRAGFRFTDSLLPLWYEEDNHCGHIVNGHVFALLGVYDLFRATGDATFRDRFYAGVETLAAAVPRFDLGFNTAYRLDAAIPAHNSYHLIHATLFEVLGRITDDRRLLAVAARFREYHYGAWYRVRTVIRLLAVLLRGTSASVATRRPSSLP
jgi:heparosan-N-sulfate-glucuronate 5-epimerase